MHDYTIFYATRTILIQLNDWFIKTLGNIKHNKVAAANLCVCLIEMNGIVGNKYSQLYNPLR